MKFVKIALAIAALSPWAAHAVLGGAPGADNAGNVSNTGNTGNASGTASRSMLQSSPTPYTMRVATGADGVTVHEYVLPSNVVFALTWQGPVRPDMNALLGSYFTNFADAGANRARGLGPMVEHSGDFHIESAGRAGHFFGKAYLPRLVPANVRMDQLQ